MKTCNENRWAFKVLAGSYLSEDDLEALGISADWHLYLSPTEPPSAAQCNQQMNAYDLIACPCCGGRATIIGTLKTCEWSVICTMCGLETAHMMQPKDAALAWNRRHAPDEEGAALKSQAIRTWDDIGDLPPGEHFLFSATHPTQQAGEDARDALLAQVLAFLLDDAAAMSYQTLGQYRTAAAAMLTSPDSGKEGDRGHE
jgi:hypothetical protein